MLPSEELDKALDALNVFDRPMPSFVIAELARDTGFPRASAIIDELTGDGVIRWDDQANGSFLLSVANCDLCGWNAVINRCSHRYYYSYAAPWEVHFYDYGDPPHHPTGPNRSVILLHQVQTGATHKIRSHPMKAVTKTILFSRVVIDKRTHNRPVAVFPNENDAKSYAGLIMTAHKSGNAEFALALDPGTALNEDKTLVPGIKFSLLTVPYAPTPGTADDSLFGDDKAPTA